MKTNKKLKKDDTLHIRVPHSVRMELKALADYDGITLSELCYNKLIKSIK